MGKYYDNSIIPVSLRRNFNVYDRINKLSIDLGSFEDNVNIKRFRNIQKFFMNQIIYLQVMEADQVRCMTINQGAIEGQKLQNG